MSTTRLPRCRGKHPASNKMGYPEPVDKLDPNASRFKLCKYDPANPNRLAQTAVVSIMEDSRQRL